MATVTLTLELDTPRIRREAFPWGVAEVALSARISYKSSRFRRTDLPSEIDLSALLSPTERGKAGAGSRHRSEKDATLDLEILGCDHGIEFTLGSATIELPVGLGPTVDQSVCRSDPFRVCVKDDAGARAGTIGGVFLARRRSPMDLSTLSNTLQMAEGESATLSERQIETGAPPQCNNKGLENKAVELLDMASKILSYSVKSSLPDRRRPHMAESPAETFGVRGLPEEENEPSSDTQKQVGVGGGPSERIPTYPEAKTPERLPVSRDAHVVAHDEKSSAVRMPTAGFRFEPTTGSVNWGRVAAVNVSKLERKGDLQTLKQFLPDVAVGKIDGDDIDASPGLINAFRLAQLQAQYVLSCHQTLQRQCNGLQTAIASMELEIEGNLQGTAAMKGHFRLLGKENRKQDKIIAGYSAMLRRHNPGLASNVRLDKKGRLKVFRIDEASRKLEKGSNRSKRSRGGRGEVIGGVRVLRSQQRMANDTQSSDSDEGTDESGLGFGLPHTASKNCTEQNSRFGTPSKTRDTPPWGTNGNRALIADHSKMKASRRRTPPPTDKAVQKEGCTHDRSEGSDSFQILTMMDSQTGAPLTDEELPLTDATVGNAGNVLSHFHGGRNSTGRRFLSGDIEAGNDSSQKQEADGLSDGRRTPPQLLDGQALMDRGKKTGLSALADQRATVSATEGSKGGICGKDAPSAVDDGTGRSFAITELIGNRNGDEIAGCLDGGETAEQPAAECFGSKYAQFAPPRARSDDDEKAGGDFVGRGEGYTKRVDPSVADQPRPTKTVSVKPIFVKPISAKSMRKSSSLSAAEIEPSSAGERISISASSLLEGAGGGVGGDELLSRREGSEETRQPIELVDMTKPNAPAKRGERDSTHAPFLEPSSLREASASRLGLEGDGVPGMSEFDLDDISEIDAGGEWGEASLSS